MIGVSVNINKLIEKEAPILDVVIALKSVHRFKTFEDRYGRTLEMILELGDDYTEIDDGNKLLEDVYDYADEHKINISV